MIAKDALDEATSHSGVYGPRDSAPDPVVNIAPAEAGVGQLEQAARDAYIGELDAQAEAVTDPEISREIQARARRVQDALPICEMFERLKRIAQAKDDSRDVSGLEGLRLRAGLDESAQALRDANPYPPLLLELFERYQESGPKLNPAFYVNGDSSETDRASVAAAVDLLGLNDVGKGTAVKPLSDREYIAKAVAKAIAPLSTRTYLLRKDLDEFKESRGIK